MRALIVTILVACVSNGFALPLMPEVKCGDMNVFECVMKLQQMVMGMRPLFERMAKVGDGSRRGGDDYGMMMEMMPTEGTTEEHEDGSGSGSGSSAVDILSGVPIVGVEDPTDEPVHGEHDVPEHGDFTDEPATTSPTTEIPVGNGHRHRHHRHPHGRHH